MTGTHPDDGLHTIAQLFMHYGCEPLSRSDLDSLHAENHNFFCEILP